EHLPDPAATLAGLRERFPAALVVVTVPSPRRAAAVEGPREPWDEPPNHLIRFSEQGLTALLRRAGLDPVVNVPPASAGDAVPTWWTALARRLVRRRATGAAVDESRARPRRDRSMAAALALLWGHCAHVQ